MCKQIIAFIIMSCVVSSVSTSTAFAQSGTAGETVGTLPHITCPVADPVLNGKLLYIPSECECRGIASPNNNATQCVTMTENSCQCHPTLCQIQGTWTCLSADGHQINGDCQGTCTWQLK